MNEIQEDDLSALKSVSVARIRGSNIIIFSKLEAGKILFCLLVFLGCVFFI